MLSKDDKLVLTGAAGLVGQNLVFQLRRQGFTNIVAIDKNGANLAVLEKMNPGVRTVLADLSQPGQWEQELAGAACLMLLQAQVTGLKWEEFEKNTLQSTDNVLRAAKAVAVPYTVFISSSVVVSVADDNYTRSKRQQERMMVSSGLPHCVLRPTLMFGWFDPKHLGWLSRFMERIPVFPIPGDGRYMRQPLYVQDFCRVIIHCAMTRPDGKIYDIVGQERVDYVDIIQTIKRCKKLKTLILHIPYWLFHLLLKVYALFSKKPPFTADQLDALTAGDDFSGVDMEKEFGVRPTPFEQAIRETFCDERYSSIALART